MLSQKGRYALRALLILAEHAPERPMMISEIAEQANVPRKFLEQILLDLKRRGIVRSLRGRQGGYLLGREPKDITFADVIRQTDGPLALSPCVSATAYHRCADCVDEATCAIRRVLLAARDATAAVLESSSLATAAPLRRASNTAPARRTKRAA